MDWRERFIGDRAFYSRVAVIVLPIMAQMGITNFVNMLDNLMIGRVGTLEMSGVAIVNQLLWVLLVSLFGAVSGAGIFCAQFFGAGDQKGIGYAFRFKLYVVALLTLAAALLLWGAQDRLIGLFLHGEGAEADIGMALGFGKRYLAVMLWSLPALGLTAVYSSTLRECGHTLPPMKAGLISVFVNLALNYVLIFGKLGFPALGVVGAAIATVIARYVELAYVLLWTHGSSRRLAFVPYLYSSLSMPREAMAKMAYTGLPLLFNEVLWSGGMAALTQAYSLRGLSAVAALNISNTLGMVFNIGYIAMGSAVGIVVGQLLGAGRLEEAKEADVKLLALSVAVGSFSGVLLFASSFFFPHFYNTTGEVKALAGGLIAITALCMPVVSFLHSCYFTLRSGGKTGITFLFDSGFMWVVNLPLAYVLSRFTSLPLLALFGLCQTTELLKAGLGYYLLRRGSWAQNLVK